MVENNTGIKVAYNCTVIVISLVTNLFSTSNLSKVLKSNIWFKYFNPKSYFDPVGDSVKSVPGANPVSKYVY